MDNSRCLYFLFLIKNPQYDKRGTTNLKRIAASASSFRFCFLLKTGRFNILRQAFHDLNNVNKEDI